MCLHRYLHGLQDLPTQGQDPHQEAVEGEEVSSPEWGWFHLKVSVDLQGIQRRRPSEAQSAILRRHLLELTQSFIIPLVSAAFAATGVLTPPTWRGFEPCVLSGRSGTWPA